eukprot:2288651-Rhodomonas_salina.2
MLDVGWWGPGPYLAVRHALKHAIDVVFGHVDRNVVVVGPVRAVEDGDGRASVLAVHLVEPLRPHVVVEGLDGPVLYSAPQNEYTAQKQPYHTGIGPRTMSRNSGMQHEVTASGRYSVLSGT